MRCVWNVAAALLVAAPLARGGQAPSDHRAIDEIVGTWRGSSICVDRQAAPACTDETVVYDITATPGKADTVTVKADKIVNGTRELMASLDYTHDAADKRSPSSSRRGRTASGA